MLLAVDIGNTNIVLGFWNKNKWLFTERFETHPAVTASYSNEVRRIVKKSSIQNEQVTQTVISSVVPIATHPMMEVLGNLLHHPPLLLDSTIDTGLKIDTNHPEKVGTDLIADAVGAYHLAKDNCIVVDFGTATTVMAVQKPGVLAGGAICAGLKASKEALIGRAAQLYDFELMPPPSVLGKNTEETLQSGLIIGHVAMVEGLIGRLKKETGPAKIVATGGFAEMLAPLTDIFDFVEPTLTLDGLRLIAERNSSI